MRFSQTNPLKICYFSHLHKKKLTVQYSKVALMMFKIETS